MSRVGVSSNGWRGRAAVLMLRGLALLLFSLCVVEILRLTLAPSPASVGIAHTNLKPGTSIRLYLRYGTLHQQILQIGGNIAIGVPMGFLLPQITPRLRGLIRVVLATCVLVTAIELVQHFFVEGRSFDVDDVILAAVGAVIGYVPLGRMFGLRLYPEHRHWWQRRLDALFRRSRARTAARHPANAI
jgi:glycopeptide antibiotics resistance protein